MLKEVAAFVTGLLTVLVLLLTASLPSQEMRLKKGELPAAVQKAADEQSQGATVKGYNREVENGKIEYEVELAVNGHSKDVTIDPEGNVLEIEEEVSLASLPPAVRQAFRRQAGQGTIRKVESLTKAGSLVAYEAQVVRAGRHSEIQLGPDGKPLDHKE